MRVTTKARKDYINKGMEYEASVCWLKYTTHAYILTKILKALTLSERRFREKLLLCYDGHFSTSEMLVWFHVKV